MAGTSFRQLLAREEFYIERGCDIELTDFPAPAFSECLDIAGIRGKPPTLAKRYGPPVPRSNDHVEEERFARTNDAHDWFQRFETRLRRFIDEVMTLTFGPDWPKHRLPNGLYDAWLEKKRKAEQAGAPVFPIICYADFTDYERVICRQDNWREIFGTFFVRKESLRESMQRLYIPRIATMHARSITQDDELLVLVEIRRLVKLFTKNRT